MFAPQGAESPTRIRKTFAAVHANFRKYESFYYACRLSIHRSRRLLRFFQSLRAAMLVGPLRSFLLRYHFGPSPTPMITDSSPLLNTLNERQALSDLERKGYAHLGKISQTCVQEILEYCEKEKRIQYWNPHQECAAIARVACNQTIVEIVRRYFGSEPILWLTQIKWSSHVDVAGRRLASSAYGEPIQYDNHSFHYDVNDVKSATVFVYLTDVDIESGPHVVIEGTHNVKSTKKLIRIVLDDHTAQKTYGARIEAILGAAGTAFIEDTLSYHKASAGTKSRCILSIDYVLRRRVPPQRPPLQ
jgi:hypothetical protein